MQTKICDPCTVSNHHPKESKIPSSLANVFSLFWAQRFYELKPKSYETIIAFHKEPPGKKSNLMLGQTIILS